VEIQPPIPPKTPQAYFIHRCCSDGYSFYREWVKNNPTIKLENVNMLNARDRGLHTKYDFNLGDLEKYAYIIIDDGEKITKLKGEV